MAADAAAGASGAMFLPPDRRRNGAAQRTGETPQGSSVTLCDDNKQPDFDRIVWPSPEAVWCNRRSFR